MSRRRSSVSPRRPSRTATAALPLLLLALLLPLLAFAQPRARGTVLFARIDSAIHPVSAEFMRESIARADAEHAAAIVFELDTPGGLLTSTRAITTAILESKTPVVVWVAPRGARAASAGFFILMSADVAAMAPETNTGAAHPVDTAGADVPGKLGEKIEQDASANIRALAQRNGRNVALAQTAVVQSRSFTAAEALQNHLVDVIAPTLPQLLQAIDGRAVRKGEATVQLHTRGAAVRELEMSSFRRFLATLADPNIAALLLTLGGLGLTFEIMTPGAVLPGIVGGICMILAFFALSVLPVDYAGLALLFLALLLYIAEIKVVSHGMLGIGGTIALVLGLSMLFQSSDPAMRVSTGLIAFLALFTVAIVGLLMLMMLRARREPVRTGREGLLQEIGTARSPLAPRGKVFVHGELWDAVSEEPVAAGEPVEILAVRNLTLAVRRYQGQTG
jgi:membrane-bound serine protease (ClpP class)